MTSQFPRTYTYLEVVGAKFLGAEDAEEGEEHDWKERSGGHRESLRHPVHSHDGDRVGAASLLQENATCFGRLQACMELR